MRGCESHTPPVPDKRGDFHEMEMESQATGNQNSILAGEEAKGLRSLPRHKQFSLLCIASVEFSSVVHFTCIHYSTRAICLFTIKGICEKSG